MILPSMGGALIYLNVEFVKESTMEACTSHCPSACRRVSHRRTDIDSDDPVQ